MAEAAPLVGRAEEQALIAGYVDRGRSVLLAGVSGVGKTFLARRLVSDAAATGRPTAWVAGTRSSQDMPMAALAPLLPPDAELTPGWASPVVFLQVIRRSLAGARPPLLGVDDAHLLDDGSATVVHQLIGEGTVSALVTITSGQPVSDAVTRLWKDGLAERVDLQPMSRAESDELVAAVLGAPCAPLALRLLWEASRGNPLYLRELTEAARSGGSLVRNSGRWNLDGGLLVNYRLSDLVQARIEQLDPPGRRAVEVAALADPVPLRLAECLAGTGALAGPEECGLVEIVDVAGRATVRFAHPVYADVVRSLVPTSRRREVCHRLADELLAAGLRRHDDEIRYVAWRLDAGDQAPVEMLVSAAWAASRALELKQAERFARAAVTTDGADPRARLALADTLYRLHRHDEAIAVVRAEPAPADDLARTELAWVEAKVLWFALDRTEEAERVLADAEAAVADPTCRAWLRVYQARLRAALGHPRETIELVRPVLDEPTGEPRVRLLAMGAVALAQAFVGRSDEAFSLAAAATDLLRDTPGEAHTAAGWIGATTWAAAWLSGDLARADATAGGVRDRGLELHHGLSVDIGSVGLGLGALRRGDIRGALTLLSDAGDAEQVEDWNGTRSMTLAGLGWAHALSGDPDAAEVALSAADKAAKGGVRWFEPLIALAWAWNHAAAGDRREALAQLRQIGADNRGRGQVPYEALALDSIARLGGPAGAAEVASRLNECAAAMDGPWASVAAAHAAALAVGDGAGLDAVSERFELLGFLLPAAEASSAAARAHESAGERGLAEAARTCAAVLIGRCPGATPPSLDLLGHVSVLTPREVEVAQLAARGNSSRDIATRLFLSVRTVDSHLAHIYAKLGVVGRHELATILGSKPDANP